MIYAAARDITERKQAKETIARYSRDLKASRESLAKLVSELEVRDLLNVIQSALNESGTPQTIDVVSALPGWVELIVPCTREAAEQIQQVVERLGADLSEDVQESVVFAFRELVMNAVEWGGGLDPSHKVRITCVRTDRMLMYRIADPGPGFSFENLDHAAITHDNPIDHMEVRSAKGLRAGGFGVLTVRASVDELVYNQKQNEVIFIKYLS
jgi:anti-sigma regulatory factor (Ser/Thr protein kinase)